MFIRLLSISSLAVLAIATPHFYARDYEGECNTGNIQCCKQTESVDEYNKAAAILGLLPIAGDLVGSVGLSCSPLLGQGATCDQQPVCCDDQKWNGLVNVGCQPINILS